ncbi:alpha/beta fold hydrolase [Haloarcula pellucida]|uniref:Alpha/beta hydrolase n=1 Tax=Haloarcula pellucida TaxID=1427151 RepID=A0A830GMT2_9EURY|nr:alpha/beta hydrolase [Halomicroarcula pellucida]MBX0349726.1 alpha/beta hydrolase [Halomicroarcula pellucida]GGN94014.1 alpha/beta hydrolase [Halomicroarcula pellucida]
MTERALAPVRRPDTDDTRTRTTTITGDRTLAYAEYGASDGVPVVFLHGTPGSRLLGSLFHDEAQRAGVRLLAPDRPGFGRSSTWPTRTLSDTGSFVGAVLDDAGVSTAGVVGFSGGGPHALAAASTLEDRILETDVIAGPAPPALRTEVPLVQRTLSALAAHFPTALSMLFGVQARLAARLDPSFVVDQYTAEDATDAVPDDVATVVQRDFVEAFSEHRRGAAHEFHLVDRPWVELVETLDGPVRFWHGVRDTNVPVAGTRRLCDRLPDARLTTFEEADHLQTLLRSRFPVLDHYS